MSFWSRIHPVGKLFIFVCLISLVMACGGTVAERPNNTPQMLIGWNARHGEYKTASWSDHSYSSNDENFFVNETGTAFYVPVEGTFYLVDSADPGEDTVIYSDYVGESHRLVFDDPLPEGTYWGYKCDYYSAWYCHYYGTILVSN